MQDIGFHITFLDQPTSDVFLPFRRPAHRLGHPNSGTQKTIFKFSFFSYISTKNTLKY